MRVRTVLVLVCMVGLTLAADQDLPTDPLEVGGNHGNAVDSGEDKAPTPCCVPVQWEGDVGGMVGLQQRRFSRPELIQEYIKISYDSKGQRVSLNGTIVTQRGPENFRVIQLFKQKKLYVVDSKGKCTYSDLATPFQAYCVSKDAKYVGRFREGLGKEVLQTDVWTQSMMGYSSSMSFTIGCAPLSEVIWGAGEGRRRVPMMGVVGYTNMQAGIKQASVFTPPKQCKAGHTEMGDGLMAFMHSKFGEMLR